jgi:7-cyano-7-deazaguanine reductase
VSEVAQAGLLSAVPGDSRVYTHLMRSLCPVTAQPDWATMIIETRGASAQREGLLRYLLAYRNHQEFHEQCVERVYTDLWKQLSPTYLSVQALYTRRGGLDICPWRCSESKSAPQGRMNRQ